MRYVFLLFVLVLGFGTTYGQQPLPPVGSPISLWTNKGFSVLDSGISVPRGTGYFFGRQSDFISQNDTLKYWDGAKYVPFGAGGADSSIFLTNYRHDTSMAALAGKLESVQAGTGIDIDDTDPLNPIINATGGAGSNMANADQAVTGDRLHDLNGYEWALEGEESEVSISTETTGGNSKALFKVESETDGGEQSYIFSQAQGGAYYIGYGLSHSTGGALFNIYAEDNSNNTANEFALMPEEFNARVDDNGAQSHAQVYASAIWDEVGLYKWDDNRSSEITLKGDDISLETTDGAIYLESGTDEVYVPHLGSGGTQMVVADDDGKLGVQAIPGSGGGGGLSSFNSGHLPPLFTTSVANATSTPNQSFTLSNASADRWFGNNTGSSAAPAYNSASALTKTDDANVTLTLTGSPSKALLNAANIAVGWTGVLSIARGGLGLSTLGSVGQSLRVNSAGTGLEYYTPSGGGGSYVPLTRTLTINGVAYDLSADRSWTIGGGGITPDWDAVMNVGNTTSTSALFGSSAHIGKSVNNSYLQVSGGTTSAAADVIAYGGTASGTAGNLLLRAGMAANARIGFFTGAGTLLERMSIYENGDIYLAGGFGLGSMMLTTNNDGKIVWQSIPGGGGGGGVTDFSAGSLSPLFTTNVNTSTTTPALTFALSNAGANTIFGNLTGSSAAPSYNSLAALTKTDDANVTLTLGGTPATALVKAVSMTLGWTGTLSVARGGLGMGSLGSPGQSIRVNSGGTGYEFYTPPSGGAGITSITQVPPTGLTVDGPLIANGTFTWGLAPGYKIPTTTEVSQGTTAYSWGDHKDLYPLLLGSYNNPSWINTLAWSKITGAPPFLTGNQNITLSGDVAGSGTTAITTTIQPNAVTTGKVADGNITFPKIQNITSARIAGRYSPGAGVMQELTLNPGHFTLNTSTGVISLLGEGTPTISGVSGTSGMSLSLLPGSNNKFGTIHINGTSAPGVTNMTVRVTYSNAYPNYAVAIVSACETNPLYCYRTKVTTNVNRLYFDMQLSDIVPITTGTWYVNYIVNGN